MKSSTVSEVAQGTRNIASRFADLSSITALCARQRLANTLKLDLCDGLDSAMCILQEFLM